MTKQLILLPLLVLLALSSCISTKEMRYFQEEDLDKKLPNFFAQELPQYKLIPNDIISVKIKTDKISLNEQYNSVSEMVFAQGNPGANYLSGYSIDNEGNISIPWLGKIKVSGLTVSQARDTIQAITNQQLNDASVFVHLLNFKVSVMGEVKRPGYYYVYNNQVNIFEALALAGDMTDLGNREQVFLVRQDAEGSIATPIDLTQIEVLNSEYYFLQPNDIVYVAPLDQKGPRSNLVTLGLFSTAFSGLSLTISLITLFLDATSG